MEEAQASSPKDRKIEAKLRSATTDLQRLQRDLQHVTLVSSNLPSGSEDDSWGRVLITLLFAF
jgi:hypothetical protein